MIDTCVITSHVNYEKGSLRASFMLEAERCFGFEGRGLFSSLAIGFTHLPPKEVMEAGSFRLALESQIGTSEGGFPVYLGQCSLSGKYAKVLNE